MNFSVRDLLSTEVLKRVSILGGSEGLNNEIKGVTIIEAPDIVRFINGGEVLLTGLYAFKSCSIETFKGYISELSEKSVSSLIIKRGRDVEFSEVKIELFKKFAEENSIPLLEVPFEVSFRDIMSLIMENLFNEEVTKLKYYKTTHDNFAALTLSLGATEDGVGKIIDVLCKLIGNPVAIFNSNRICLGTTHKEINTLKINNTAEQLEIGFYTNNNYIKQMEIIAGEEKKQYLIYLNISTEVKGYLVITEMNRVVDIMDYIAIENAITEILHVYSRQYAIAELEKKFQNDIIYNLLNGKIRSKDQLLKNINLLDMDINANYRVLVFGVQPDRADISLSFDEKTNYTSTLNDAILMYFENTKIQNDIDRIIVIQRVESEQSKEDYRIEVKIIAEKIQKYITKRLKHLRVKAGVGKVVDGIINLPKSFKEAKDAFHFADVAIEISNIGVSRIILFSDLGIFKLLCQIEDTNLLLEYIPQSLQKLYEYKKTQREDLLLTLKTYLERNQNLKKTAEDLFIHYKTAAYRIEKIATITGMDFENPSEVLAVRIGFIVHKMMENHNSDII